MSNICSSSPPVRRMYRYRQHRSVRSIYSSYLVHFSLCCHRPRGWLCNARISIGRVFAQPRHPFACIRAAAHFHFCSQWQCLNIQSIYQFTTTQWLVQRGPWASDLLPRLTWKMSAVGFRSTCPSTLRAFLLGSANSGYSHCIQSRPLEILTLFLFISLGISCSLSIFRELPSHTH